MSTLEVEDCLPLFDALPDVVFFIKDGAGRYLHVNMTLVRRLGRRHRHELSGKLTTELFPAALGRTYAAQDQQVLAGATIANQLEVHLFPNRAPGWCLTCKRPLRDAHGIHGLIGISRDLGQPDGSDAAYPHLRTAVEIMQAAGGDAITVAEVARRAGLSVARLERHFRRVFQLTPRQMLIRLRIENAMAKLRLPGSIAAVAADCGYADQSAFTRQFKATVGVTPRDYRRLLEG